MKDLFICYKDFAGNFRFCRVPDSECFMFKDIPVVISAVVGVMTKSHLEQIAQALNIEVLDDLPF